MVINKAETGKSQGETYIVRAVNKPSYFVVMKVWGTVPELFLAEDTRHTRGSAVIFLCLGPILALIVVFQTTGMASSLFRGA